MSAIGIVGKEIPKRSDKVKRIHKFGYGVGDLSQGIASNISIFFVTFFLLEVAGLRPGAVGVIFLISKIWDGITDPLIGMLADNTRSRHGSLRPWLLYGAVPFGVAFFLQWIVPPGLEGGQLFAYYLVIALFYQTAFTAVSVPYSALNAKMTQDYDERTNLNLYRFSFSLIGALSAAGLHPVIVNVIGADNIQLGYMASAGIWATFIVLSVWTSFAFTYENQYDIQKKGFDLIGGLKLAMRNRPFLYVTGIYITGWLALQLTQTNLLLYLRYWLEREDLFTALLFILLGTAFLFLSVWSWVSARLGKRYTYIAGAVFFSGALFGLFFLQPDQVFPAYIVAFVGGIGLSVFFLIPWSMIPDVVEYSEYEFGERREGEYYGLFIFIQKIGIAGGIAISNFVLDFAGFVTPETAGEFVQQPDAVLNALRLFVSIIPASIALFGIPLAFFYPITRKFYAEIRASLDGDRA